MNLDFSAAMRQAAQLTRAQKLMEATRVIQRALTGRRPIAPDIGQPFERLLAPPPQESETASEISSETQAAVAVEPPPALASARVPDAPVEIRPERARRPLGEVLTLLRQADLPVFIRHRR